MMHDDILFWEYEWSKVSDAQKEGARRYADQLPQAAFEGRELAEIAAELCEKYSLVPPTLDPIKITVEIREIEIDVSHDRKWYFGRGGPHYVKGTAFDVRVHFNGDPKMFKIKPNNSLLNFPRGRVESNSVAFTISGIDLSTDKVKAEITSRVVEIQTWLDFLSESARDFPNALNQVVVQTLEARKSKLSADSDLISGLGFKDE